MMPGRFSVASRAVAELVSTAKNPRDSFLPLNLVQKVFYPTKPVYPTALSSGPSGLPSGELIVLLYHLLLYVLLLVLLPPLLLLLLLLLIVLLLVLVLLLLLLLLLLVLLLLLLVLLLSLIHI